MSYLGVNPAKSAGSAQAGLASPRIKNAIYSVFLSFPATHKPPKKTSGGTGEMLALLSLFKSAEGALPLQIPAIVTLGFMVR